MTAAILTAALALACAAHASAQEPLEVVEKPAPKLQPAVPSIERDEQAPAPEGHALVRNGVATGRFVVEGQETRYPFDAREGELSLFDFGTWGYSRGWQSTARLTVIGPGGTKLLDALRPGGTVYRKFLPFVAPATGRYQLVLKAQKECFRYTLVRHSDYRARADGDLYAVHGPRVHGWLADPGDRAHYAIMLAEGETVFLAARNTHEAARKAANSTRRKEPWQVVERQLGKTTLQSAAGGAMRGAMEEGMRGMRGMRAASKSYPDLVVSIAGSGAAPTPSTLFTAPAAGTYTITVGGLGGDQDQGGLFDLVVQRSPEKVRVYGFVGDRDDEPVAGVALHFLREPDFDYVGTATTDAEGGYDTSVPPGSYTIFLAQGEEGRPQSLRTALQTEREVNAVYLRGR